MYFCLTDHNGTHIATVCAFTDENLTEKVKTACKEHFDPDDDTMQIPSLNMEDYKYGREGNVGVEFVQDGEDCLYDITICESWLY